MDKASSILIIEDDEDIRESLKNILEMEGYEVHAAKNGKEGLELLRNIPAPGIIFLDLMMPVMSGWDFLEARKKDGNSFGEVPVYVLTAVHNPMQIPKANGTIRKPIELENLLEIVREFCGDPQPARL